MYPVSEAYKNAISQNERNVRIAGTITLKDNSVIQIDDEDILQGSLYFTEQCVSGEDIEIGNVYASEMGLTLTSPPENPYSLDGARIIVNFGIETSEGVWEYVPLGYFYVTEIERKHTAVNLKALDGLILFDVDLSGVLTTGTPYSLIQSCCTKAGVTLATSYATFATFANGTSSFALPADSKIETCRDLIMWVCQITGTFARMNRLGQLEIVPVTARTSVKTITKAERFTSEVSDFEVKVTKVAMKIGEAEYSQGAEGMTMTLEENPLLINKEPAEINAALNELLDQVTLAEYVPYSLDFAGDPAIQAGDWVTLADTARLGGGDVTSLVTHTTWRYRGPHNIKAVGKSGLIRGVQAQQSKTVSAIVAIAKAAQELAQAANQSTQLINDAIGGHVLIRREPGGTNEILIMDNEDPDQARKIWRWNMGGLGYSDNVVGADNPARKYDVAMTMDGAINADFIKTGKLTASVVQIGPETTFEEGYDPSEKETPEGAQQKAEAAEAAAKAHAEAEAAAAKQAAKEHASGLLQSLANGEYSGTFIDGTSIISPTVVGLQGTFAELMAGNPFGARLELGESAGEPFLTFYDANEKRLSILKDKIEFHKDSSLAGYLEAVYTEAKDEYGAPFDNLNIAVNSRAFTLKGMLVLKTPDSNANQQVYFGQGYSLYCDNVGAGADNTRLWLHAPNNGEVVIGPEGGADYLHLLRLRASTIRVEGNITAGLAGSYDLGTETSPFRFLYLSQQLKFRGSATAIDIIAHDTDHWLGFYDRAASAHRLRLYQDRCHVYNDLRYDGGLYQGTTRGIPAADIRNGAVTESKIASGAVTSAKIGSGAVTTAKIAANAVTSAKTSGVTTGTLKLRDQLEPFIVELTFTNGLLTSYSRYMLP